MCSREYREEGKTVTFSIVYIIWSFLEKSHRLDSSVRRATVFRLEGPKFESWLRLTFFFVIFIILYSELLLLYLKRAVLYENVINLIILERLKVFFSNILLKKYHSSMKCGQDKKNDLKDDYNWFRLANLPWHQSTKENIIKI